MEKKKMLICCCAEAEHNCYLTCPKGRKINPDQVFITPTWEKKVRGK